MKYLVTSPWWFRLCYPAKAEWHYPKAGKTLFLTFDDGPHPTITPRVLDQLKEYNAKATFFCIGKNVQAHPETYRRILDEGHRVGNHSFNHLNGWKTDTKTYMEDIRKASQWIDSDLYRPPYGRILPFQAHLLRKAPRPYRLILWDVLSADFDTSIIPEKSFQHVQRHAKNGSVIVFHDSEKAFPRMEYALEQTLSFFSEKGYRFEAIQ